MGHKPINMKPLAMVGLLAASFSSIAADGDNIGTITFRTATEATVNEVKSLNFGDKLAVNKDASCAFDIEFKTVGSVAGQYKVDFDETKYAFESESCGGVTGALPAAQKTNLEAANIQPAIFEISGVAGQSVGIKVSSVSNEFLSFDPLIRFVDADFESLTESAPTLTAVVTPASPAPTLALGPLRSLVAGQPHPLAVGTMIVVGEIKTLKRLETGTAYELTYSIDVTYN